MSNVLGPLNRIDDYKKTFATKHGKRVLLDLMSMSGITSLVDPASAPNELCFIEGKRRLIHEIIEILETDMEQFRKDLISSHKQQVEYSQIDL